MSNMNRIKYKGSTLIDKDLAIGGSLSNNLMLYHAMIAEELKPDTFTFNLIYDKNKPLLLVDKDGKYLKTSDGKYLAVKNAGFDPETFSFGDPLEYGINDGATIMGRFYVRHVTRIQKNIYRLECTSAIGLTTYYGHNGGIYEGETLGNIVSEIMGDLPYTIDSDLAKVTCTGWLPKVKAARDNLQALLFMSGGSVKKNTNGTVNFGYIGSGTTKTIAETRLNTGGQFAHLAPATRVEVTAYEFHALETDESVVLYDNTAGVSASSLVVDFQEPCHDLVADGLTIEASGANYAIVSGVGVLTGQKYTRTTSVYALNTGKQSEPNIIQVSNNYMITPGNIANVTKRIVGYYGIAKEVNYLMRVNNERPGDKVTFTDPFGDTQTGYIKQMNVTLSKNLNAQATFALDWTPGPFGDSYSAFRIFRQSDIVNGRLTLPSNMVGAQALVVLLGGAGGGQAGYDGKAGTAPSSLASFQAHAPGPGGPGGDPGQPGERGKILSFYVDELPAYYTNVAIGVGGPGGASNGELGQPGGDTTLGEYSTADGTQLIDDYTNFLTGTAYATVNKPGEAGSDGGIGAGYSTTYGVDTSTNGGDHVCEDGTVTPGGAYANGTSYSFKHGSNNRRYRDTGGAGGGGAAHGAPGSDGFTANSEWDEDNIGGSVGGDGADAVAPLQAAETVTGRGGHGGGGGGGAAQCRYKTDNTTGYSYGFNDAGKGGKGSAGGQGGDGLIIIYFNPAA